MNNLLNPLISKGKYSIHVNLVKMSTIKPRQRLNPLSNQSLAVKLAAKAWFDRWFKKC